MPRANLDPPYPWKKKITIGTRVQLNSGSPKMLVVDIINDYMVETEWKENGRIHSGQFNWSTLKPWDR